MPTEHLFFAYSPTEVTAACGKEWSIVDKPDWVRLMRINWWWQSGGVMRLPDGDTIGYCTRWADCAECLREAGPDEGACPRCSEGHKRP